MRLVEPRRSAAAAKRAPLLLPVVVVENAAELGAKRRTGARGERQLFRGRPGGSRGDLIDGVDPRPAAPGFAPAPVEPLPRRCESLHDHRHEGPVPLQHPPDDLQCIPEALLQGPGVIPAPAPLVGRIAAGKLPLHVGQKGFQGLEETVGAELVARPVGGLPLDAVPPALDRPVDDGRGLAVLHLQGLLLGGDDLLPVFPVGDKDHVPVVQVGQFRRRPLDIIPRRAALAADVVAVDRRLIPVDVEDHVLQRGGPRGGQGLADPAGGQPALALDDMDPRRVCTVVVERPQGEADRASQADARGARREADKGGRRRRMAVQNLGVELLEKRRFRDGVPPEAEEVFQAELEPLFRGEELGRRDPEGLVPHRPERVETHRLVARGKGDYIGILPFRPGDVIIQGIEKQPRQETARPISTRPGGPRPERN